MAQRRHLLAVVAAAAVTFTSCGKAPESTGGAGPDTASPPDTEKIELRLQLKQGETYKLRMSSEQTITQTMGETKQETPQTTGFDLSHLVKEVRDDGTTVLQVTFDALRLKQKGIMGTVDYDSSNPPPAESLDGMVKGLAALVGKGFTVDLTAKGKATNVEGADQLVAALTETIEVPMPALQTVVEEQLKRQFGNEAMKEMMEQMIGVYPDGPAGPGDSWTRKVAVSRGFSAIMNDTWTLKSRQNGVAALDLQSTVEPDPDAGVLDMGLAKVTYELGGTRNGSVELDEATGWVLRSTVQQSLSGELKVEGGPEAGGGMAIPLSIEGTTRVERL
ncbi:MAG: hypothetical protein HQ582_26560 [Planctomycetes bacterium]|nr:hypothetical protein [Planctomycetota bacterium]